MAARFDTHSFAPSYALEFEPEFPPDGVWTEPVHAFGRDGSHSTTVVARWGAPSIIQVTPRSGESWIGMFESGGLSEGVSEAHACPDPSRFCVISGGLAYLVNADVPMDDAVPLLTPVMQVAGIDDPALLLLVTYSELVALGRDGVAWTSGRIALDGLRVESIVGAQITCLADNLEGGEDRLVLDASSGQQILGRRFDSIWPPDALA
jgi:hypothetical protein